MEMGGCGRRLIVHPEKEVTAAFSGKGLAWHMGCHAGGQVLLVPTSASHGSDISFEFVRVCTRSTVLSYDINPYPLSNTVLYLIFIKIMKTFYISNHQRSCQIDFELA